MILTRIILATVLMAMSSVTVAAPTAKREEPECAERRNHVHHLHKRAIVTEYAYVYITVDAAGSVLPSSSSQLTVAPSKVQISSSSSSAAAPPSTSALKIVPETTSTSPSTYSSVSSSPESLSSSSLDTPSSRKWQDGKVPCSQFPSDQYGVVALKYLGFGGWSGIYHQDKSSGGSCSEGAHCSYACESGMAKTQWPLDQPENGVSVGGLICKNGFLHRTNKATLELCAHQPDKAIVRSYLDRSVAICQTDYPGTENMVIPTIVQPGSTSPLTCIDQDNYYSWLGRQTSAQFYVNNAGVSQQNGCVWGMPGGGVGNWAPLNFGAGYTNGIAYLSLIQNPLNTLPANFDVEIVADNGSIVNGQCKYSQGKYYGDGNDGCTVAVVSGRGVFVLSS